MADYTLGFILLIVLYFCGMLGLLIAFYFLKKYRSNPDPIQKYNIFIQENSLPLKALLLKLFTTSLEEIKHECGEEAHQYLYMTKVLAILTSMLCPLGLFVLLPVYSLGDFYDIDLLQMSLGNIFDREELLVAPFLVFVVFTCALYYVLKLFVDDSLKESSFSNINTAALRVIGLPQHLQKSDLTLEVVSSLNMETDKVYVVPHFKAAIQFDKELKIAKNELMHYLDVERFKGKREAIKLKRFTSDKVDAIEYWEKQVKVIEYKLQNEYKATRVRNSGVCIVKTEMRREEVLARLGQRFRGVYLAEMVVPNDVRWENIENDERKTKSNHTKGTVCFFIVFLIFFTPEVFTEIVNAILESLGLPAEFLGLLSFVLPGVLLIIYQLWMVPTSVAYLVKREQHYSKNEEVTSSIRKYLLFFLFSMLFIPAIGLDVLNILALALLYDGLDQWSADLVIRIYTNLFWFVSLILSQAFIINFVDLIKIGTVVKMKYKALRAVSERETYNAYLPEPFHFTFEYSVMITCFSALLLYSIVFPLILLFGTVYLWIRYFVHKYDIMSFCSKEYVKSQIATNAVKAYMFCIVFFQWFMCFLFLFTGFVAYDTICSLWLLAAAGSLPCIWVKYNKKIALKVAERKIGLLDEVYEHPLEESCAKFLRQEANNY